MSETQNRSPDKITVLVFKDNYAARTFQISLSWLYRLGLMSGALITVTLASAYFAIKYYRTAHRMDPSHVQELEDQLSDLKLSYKTLEAKSLTAAAAPSVSAPAVAQALPQATAAPVAAVVPVPTVTVTVTPAAPTAAEAKPGLVVSQTQSAEVPIVIDTPRFIWSGKALRARFSIQYSKEGGGSQNGRIVVLARGPDTIVSYPDGTLNKAGAATLLAPAKGEYFSVSRYREVNAEFPMVHSPSAIQALEIFLFNQNDQILIHRITPVQGTSRESAKKPVSTQPSPTSEPESSIP